MYVERAVDVQFMHMNHEADGAAPWLLMSYKKTYSANQDMAVRCGHSSIAARCDVGDTPRYKKLSDPGES